jgi:hypothetical protein
LPDQDTILAVLSSGIALAGLLLVFSGFMMAKAESLSSLRGDKYRYLSLGTLVPILFAIFLSWLSIDAIQGNKWAGYHLLIFLKIQLALTGAYAIIGLIEFIF